MAGYRDKVSHAHVRLSHPLLCKFHPPHQGFVVDFEVNSWNMILIEDILFSDISSRQIPELSVLGGSTIYKSTREAAGAQCI